jgi:hypothetical protein
VLYHTCKVTYERFYCYKTEKLFKKYNHKYTRTIHCFICEWELSVRLGKSRVASCSSMPIFWSGSTARRKLFLGEKQARKACMCPWSVGKGQVLGKTLHAIMNWNF